MADPQDRHDNRDQLDFDQFLDALVRRPQAQETATSRHDDCSLEQAVQRFHALAAADQSAPPPIMLAAIWEHLMDRPTTAQLVSSSRFAPPSPNARSSVALPGGSGGKSDAGRWRPWRPAMQFAVAAIAIFFLVAALIMVRNDRGSGSQGSDYAVIPAPTQSVADALVASCPMPTGSVIPRAQGYFTPWGLGTSPVWIAGWSNPPDSLRTDYPNVDIPYYGPQFAGPTDHGWGMKALWVITGGSNPPVTLRGSRLSDGAPLWFDVTGQKSGPTAVLDPANPGIPVQHGSFREWPSSIYFPGSGCYQLEAQWAGGSWRVVIPIVTPDDAPQFTPRSAFIEPDPADCTVEPRSMESLLRLAATPSPAAITPTASLTTEGTPVDGQTGYAVVDTVRQVYACIAANDPQRVNALFTDNALREFLAHGLLSATDAVEGPGEREAFRLRQVSLLPDGRVAASIQFQVSEGIYGETWLFVRQDDRYLIDVVGLPSAWLATPIPLSQ